MRKQIEILRNIFVCDQRDILPDRKSDENFTQHYYFSVGYNGFLHFFFEKWTFRQDAPVILAIFVALIVQNINVLTLGTYSPITDDPDESMQI